jgi:hypothetical protein
MLYQAQRTGQEHHEGELNKGGLEGRVPSGTYSKTC